MLNLPFDTSWPDVKKALDFHSNLVIVAEPGAGKTTRLPPGLIAQKLVNGKILVLEPRRLAARAAAERVANEFNWNFPGKVGYSVRFDNQTTASTALIYLTEGLFLKYLQGDTELQGVAAVVLDEFHERNRYTDIAIGALKELQTLSRPDLKVIVMSATLDSQKVSEFLEINGVPAPVISVPGRTFPVKITHTQTPLKLVTDREWVQSVQKQIIKTLQESTDASSDSTGQKNQDILVFLPGTNEIRRVRSLLLESLEFTQPNIEVIELHGSLSLSDQAKVLNSNCLLDQFPSKQPRRIILATNIAETSLTLDGVGIVIDTGLERTQETDRLGFSSLTLHRITLASAKQRAGRAGRQAPGTAHRLWSKMDELSFPKFAEPEILKIDLTDTVLDLASLGISDPRHFSWFESPSEEKLILATKTLQDLGAIYPNGKLTQAGTFMIRAGLSARASRILFEAYTIATLEAYEIAASLAALLTEKDFLFLSDSKTNMRSLVDSECDLRIRYEYLKKRPPSTKQDPRFRIDHSALKNFHRVKEAYLHLVANL